MEGPGTLDQKTWVQTRILTAKSLRAWDPWASQSLDFIICARRGVHFSQACDQQLPSHCSDCPLSPTVVRGSREHSASQAPLLFCTRSG